MTNFKSSAPVALQVKMKMLAEMINDDFGAIRSNRGESQIGESRLDEIEGNYVSGWMPRQDGGFTVSEWMRSDIDNSYHFTEKQTDFINEQINNCFKSFLSGEEITEEEFNSLYDLETGNEDFRQQFAEYEMEWFSDGALLAVQMFVEGYADKIFDFDKEPEKIVTIRACINYADGEYAREKYAEDIKQIVLSVDEFMSMSNEEIINQITF